MSDEVFFRPLEIECTQGVLTADVYNLCHSLLSRSPLDCVFVPIRDMQYMAILDKKEIIFVDSLAYQMRNGKGGRIITTAWQFPANKERDSLAEPLPCTYVFYHPKAKELQLRLQGSFRQAIIQLDKRYRESILPAHLAKILPWQNKEE
ncbi:hypothetical protein JYT78_00260 [bacterium AH-315-I20]|nr:hypothetical protein [bacterium AH-315-I20]